MTVSSFRAVALVLPLVLIGCARKPPPPAPAVAVAPVPQPAFLPAQLSRAEATSLLANDPLAMRFLALRYLAEDRVIAPTAAESRFAVNKGALLPLSEREPPATGLDRSIPATNDLAQRLRKLAGDQGRGTAETRLAESEWLLDGILPLRPAARSPLWPRDMIAAQALLDRTDVLYRSGLITERERDDEKRAVVALMESGKLPPVYQEPAPPAAPVERRSAKSTRPHRGPGLKVVADPPGVAAPALAKDAKGPAGVHLMLIASTSHMDAAWSTLKSEHPELAPLTAKAVKADLGDVGVTYRLVAGPLEPKAAEQLCATLRTKGQSCTPTPFAP